MDPSVHLLSEGDTGSLIISGSLDNLLDFFYLLVVILIEELVVCRLSKEIKRTCDVSASYVPHLYSGLPTILRLVVNIDFEIISNQLDGSLCQRRDGRERVNAKSRRNHGTVTDNQTLVHI